MSQLTLSKGVLPPVPLQVRESQDKFLTFVLRAYILYFLFFPVRSTLSRLGLLQFISSRRSDVVLVFPWPSFWHVLSIVRFPCLISLCVLVDPYHVFAPPPFLPLSLFRSLWGNTPFRSFFEPFYASWVSNPYRRSLGPVISANSLFSVDPSFVLPRLLRLLPLLSFSIFCHIFVAMLSFFPPAYVLSFQSFFSATRSCCVIELVRPPYALLSPSWFPWLPSWCLDNPSIHYAPPCYFTLQLSRIAVPAHVIIVFTPSWCPILVTASPRSWLFVSPCL